MMRRRRRRRRRHSFLCLESNSTSFFFKKKKKGKQSCFIFCWQCAVAMAWGPLFKKLSQCNSFFSRRRVSVKKKVQVCCCCFNTAAATDVAYSAAKVCRSTPDAVVATVITTVDINPINSFKDEIQPICCCRFHIRSGNSQINQ